MNGQAQTWGEVMRHKLHGALDGGPTQKAIDGATAGRDALETQIGRNLPKLAAQDLFIVGWIVDELLDRSEV